MLSLLLQIYVYISFDLSEFYLYLFYYWHNQNFSNVIQRTDYLKIYWYTTFPTLSSLAHVSYKIHQIVFWCPANLSQINQFIILLSIYSEIQHLFFVCFIVKKMFDCQCWYFCCCFTSNTVVSFYLKFLSIMCNTVLGHCNVHKIILVT